MGGGETKIGREVRRNRGDHEHHSLRPWCLFVHAKQRTVNGGKFMMTRVVNKPSSSEWADRTLNKVDGLFTIFLFLKNRETSCAENAPNHKFIIY